MVGRTVESRKAKHMQTYRETLEILLPEMHGYRSSTGTMTALLEMGEHVQVSFMDISAGFYTDPSKVLVPIS